RGLPRPVGGWWLARSEAPEWPFDSDQKKRPWRAVPEPGSHGRMEARGPAPFNAASPVGFPPSPSLNFIVALLIPGGRGGSGKGGATVLRPFCYGVEQK